VSSRYPGYDVLAKRHTPSWNEKTRRVIDQRLATRREPRFFSPAEWRTLVAVADRILPQSASRPTVPIAGMIDTRIFEGHDDGYRDYRLPPMGAAWRSGLKALDLEARHRLGVAFHMLAPAEQDVILEAAQAGRLTDPAWEGMQAAVFFEKRLLSDIAAAYYAHPIAWNEIGFGGPASPRGYVRMQPDRRDPWEAAEAKPGKMVQAVRSNRRVGR